MDTVNLFDAKNRLSALVDRVEEGHEERSRAVAGQLRALCP